MAFQDSLKNLASSLTGNVNKAYILMPKTSQQPGTAGIPNVGGIADETSSIRDAAAALQWEATRGLTGMKGVTAGGIGDSVNSLFGASSALTSQVGAVGNGFIPVQVQYNPSSISLESEAGEVNRQGASGAGYEQIKMPEETVLRMDLIFDEMNIKDAFMWDNLRVFTAGDLLQKGKQLVNAKKGEYYTVQNTVELFAAAISQAPFRMVGVVWNKMTFWGELFGTSINYTMFNRKGDPVRATVSLQIRQSEDDQASALSQAVSFYWDEAYKKLFMSAYQGGGQAGEQSLTNLLNI